MRILEKLLAIGTFVALILKFNLIPGGDQLALITMLLLGCIYYPLGFLFFNQIKLRHIFKKEAYKDATATSIIFAIITGMALSTIVIGSLFKLMRMSGANDMLLIAILVTFVVAIVAAVLLFKNNDRNSKFILLRVVIVGGIGTFLLFTSELAIVKFEYRRHPAYVEAYTNYQNNPGNQQLYERLEYVRNNLGMPPEEAQGKSQE